MTKNFVCLLGGERNERLAGSALGLVLERQAVERLGKLLAVPCGALGGEGGRAVADVRAAATSHDHVPLVAQHCVSLIDGVHVDAEVSGERAHAGKRVTCAKIP